MEGEGLIVCAVEVTAHGPDIAGGGGGYAGEKASPGFTTLLQYRWQELGLTLVIVTHDTSAARRAQQTGVMKEGRLVARHTKT